MIEGHSQEKMGKGGHGSASGHREIEDADLCGNGDAELAHHGAKHTAHATQILHHAHTHIQARAVQRDSVRPR